MTPRAFCTAVALVLVGIAHIPQCHGMYIAWLSDPPADYAFSIPMLSMSWVNMPVNMKVPKSGFYRKGSVQYYRNLSDHFTLDERCARGMELSAMWHHYSPYVETNSFKSPNSRVPDIIASGMFPKFIGTIMKHCCHQNSSVKFGMFLRTVREAENYIEKSAYDFSFPINVFDPKSKKFKDRPFISLVTAPRVILLVKDQTERKSRTDVMVQTIMEAWPMMVFIFVTASLSGIIVWFLDHSANPEEFPPNFFVGCWEGFWWAFVTMTTVGYGDISPKSKLARVFCVMWIFLGLSVISIYTAIVTAALSASTSEHFTIHGSIIGAVNGSEEYKLGVSMNADMKAFSKMLTLTQALLKGEIDGALVDSYIVNYFGHFIEADPVRVERSIEHSITYGIVLPENSSKTEACFRRYIKNNPNEMFDVLASFLKPLKNPTDEINQELRAAEELFYNEDIFNKVVMGGGIAISIILLFGLAYDFIKRHTKMKKYKKEMSSTEYLALKEQTKKKPLSRKQLKAMVTEYQSFHSEWLRKFEAVSERQGQESCHAAGAHDAETGNNNADNPEIQVLNEF